jgi:alpha-L-fucosidase 2
MEKINCYILTLITATFLTLTSRPIKAQDIYAGKYKAVFNTPPTKAPTSRTPDAPLAGNGDIGLTLGGNGEHLKLYLGKNDFWRSHEVYPGGGIAFPGFLELISPELKGSRYYAEQVLDSAYIKARFSKKDFSVDLKTWVSATTNQVIIELKSTKKTNLQLNLKAATGNTSTISSGKTGDIIWVTRSFEKGKEQLDWPAHVAIAKKIVGKTLNKNGSLTLNPNEATRIVLSIFTNFDDKQWKEKTIEETAKFNNQEITSLWSKHLNWWKNYWLKSEIKIGDPFIEKYYYASQYLFGSTSRGNKFAPGIWGPFITRDSSAWGGDYHLNYNYQAPYWAAFSSNHIEETDNFDQPLLDYIDKGKAFAKQLLGINGIYYPVGIGPMALTTTRWPFTEEEMLQRYGTRENTIDGGYKFLGQKINAVFSVGNMLMRFYSTYDKIYAQRVYPYILECANFWEDYLKFENGKYVIYMDHYGEVMPKLNNQGNWKHLLGDYNSTLSLGLVKMLFIGILDISEFLEIDKERRDKWQHIVKHLSPFPLGEKDGRLSLKSVESSPSPWHQSVHGLSRVSIHGLILPGGVAGPKTDSAFNNILLNDVRGWEKRMNGKGSWGNTFGNGVETCFPAAVRVGYDSDKILAYLKDRIEVGSYPNLWITAGGGGTETLSTVPLTVTEMLMQSYEHVVRIFPNWNKARNAEFTNLRAYGAFLISSKLENKEIKYVKVISEAGRKCVMENPWPGKKVHLTRGNIRTEITGNTLTFETKKGEYLELSTIH